MKRGRGKGEAVSPNMPPRTAQPVTIEQATRLAHQHWNNGDADRTERACNQILTARPNYADALHLLGLIAPSAEDPPRTKIDRTGQS